MGEPWGKDGVARTAVKQTQDRSAAARVKGARPKRRARAIALLLKLLLAFRSLFLKYKKSGIDMCVVCSFHHRCCKLYNIFLRLSSILVLRCIKCIWFFPLFLHLDSIKKQYANQRITPFKS
jgi:hypothetical protein